MYGRPVPLSSARISSRWIVISVQVSGRWPASGPGGSLVSLRAPRPPRMVVGMTQDGPDQCHSVRNPSTIRELMRLNTFLLGAGERVRTAGLPFTRSTATCIERSSCTDNTDHRTDGTRCAGIIPHAVPRTVPRPRLWPPPSCSLCVTTLRHSHQDLGDVVDMRLGIAYRGFANCGKARRVGMTLRHEQPVAG